MFPIMNIDLKPYILGHANRFKALWTPVLFLVSKRLVADNCTCWLFTMTLCDLRQTISPASRKVASGNRSLRQ